MTHLKQTPIACRELVFYLVKIPRDTITVYISLCFLLNEAVDPPVTKTYIDPTAFHQKSRSATPQRIPKTIIFFNTKNQAISVYRKTLEYLIQLHLIYYTEDVTSLILAVFHQLISSKGKKLILAEFRKLAEFLKIQIIFIIEAIGIGVNLFDAY